MKVYLNNINVEMPGFLKNPNDKNTINWNISELKNLTVIIGKNGSGKSILLRNIFKLKRNDYYYCNPERAGIFRHNASIHQDWISRKNNPNTIMQSRDKNINDHYYDQVISNLEEFFRTRGMIDNPNINISEISELLTILLPDYDLKIIKIFPFIQPKIDLKSLSSGETNLLGLGIDIISTCGIWELENKEERILLIDEPDTHLHYDLHQNFALFLFEVSKRFKVQIIIATHSSTLLAALGHYFSNEMGVIYINKNNLEHKSICFNQIQKDLCTILGGHALMGPLFNIPILLVEGDDDYQIWSQIPRYHNYGFAVNPCNGDEIKKYQKTLEILFNTMLTSKKSKSGFAILDMDKKKPNSNSHPQNHVAFMQLNCHESENLYLTDEILNNLGLDWQQAKNKIKERAKDFGNKALKLQTIDRWDRRKEDIKDCIKEIALILDDKQISWTLRVAKAIDSISFDSEVNEFGIRNFLGKEIIELLKNVSNKQIC